MLEPRIAFFASCIVIAPIVIPTLGVIAEEPSRYVSHAACLGCTPEHHGSSHLGHFNQQMRYELPAVRVRMGGSRYREDVTALVSLTPRPMWLYKWRHPQLQQRSIARSAI